MAKRKKMEWYDNIAYLLIVIGAINWGLAVFDFNLVTTIFGTFSKFIYGLVGLSGLYAVWTFIKLNK